MKSSFTDDLPIDLQRLSKQDKPNREDLFEKPAPLTEKEEPAEPQFYLPKYFYYMDTRYTIRLPQSKIHRVLSLSFAGHSHQEIAEDVGIKPRKVTIIKRKFRKRGFSFPGDDDGKFLEAYDECASLFPDDQTVVSPSTWFNNNYIEAEKGDPEPVVEFMSNEDLYTQYLDYAQQRGLSHVNQKKFYDQLSRSTQKDTAVKRISGEVTRGRWVIEKREHKPHDD